MKVRIKRLTKTIPLPKRHTDSAAAFDLAASASVTIAPGQIGYVPLGVAIETPKDHFLLLACRSSLHKRGLMPANGIGIIDPDYSGDEDEIKAALYNFSGAPVTIESGERIMQALFIKHADWQWEEVEQLGNRTRGGFGTTGHR